MYVSVGPCGFPVNDSWSPTLPHCARAPAVALHGNTSQLDSCSVSWFTSVSAFSDHPGAPDNSDTKLTHSVPLPQSLSREHGFIICSHAAPLHVNDMYGSQGVSASPPPLNSAGHSRTDSCSRIPAYAACGNASCI